MFQQFCASVLVDGEGIDEDLLLTCLSIVFGFYRGLYRQFLGQVVDDSGEEVVSLAFDFGDGEIDREELAGFLLASGLTAGSDDMLFAGLVVGLNVYR